MILLIWCILRSSRLTGSIRLSLGTAATLGLMKCRVDVQPTTAYTMTYTPTRCSANCAFCAQSRTSSSPANKLSRVTWPEFNLNEVVSQIEIKHSFQRLCIQTICYPNLEKDLIQLIETFSHIQPNIPLSAALPPLSISVLSKLENLGLERVAISLDAVTAKLFDKIKGSQVNSPFSWITHYNALLNAQKVFGRERTTTHLIIGLGETEFDAVHLIQELIDQGITIGLFPFTPVAGTPLANQPPASLATYRQIQLAHYLISRGIINLNQMKFNKTLSKIDSFGIPPGQLDSIINTGQPFRTAGCPSCNRPFFTERPSGPLYNYPVMPSPEDIQLIRKQMRG